MPSHRFPGVLCGDSQRNTIDEGTHALCQMPAPGAFAGMWLPAWPVVPKAWPYRSHAKARPNLDFLFTQCRNPTTGLSESDFDSAAESLGVEPAAIKAVAEVETKSKAFEDSGRPVILFERHYFHDLTSGKYDVQYPKISCASSGGYGKYSAQYTKLELAYGLDQDAALKSASWGRFQIMGNNYKAAGFSSVHDFVFAMTRSEHAHLDAFVKFVANSKIMLAALKDKKWATFARNYNGKKYKTNNYDTKMEEAYGKFKASLQPAEGAAK